MSLALVPEAMAPMGEAMAAMTPPAVGDVGTRRVMREPILDASGKAQPIPEDVTTHDGAQITMRWYAKNDTTPGSAALFFHGGGTTHLAPPRRTH
ncbi:hypothetical protein ACWDRB_44405 [Nonomuraea sp. NPDC003707]